MDAIQANALITKGARIDPRMGRSSADEQALLAEGWAELLEDVALADAERALTEMLKRQTAASPVIMPADILAAVGEVGDDPMYVDHTAAFLAAKKAQLVIASGLSESEFDAAVARDGDEFLASVEQKAVEA